MDEVTLFVVGLVATVLVWIFKTYMNKTGKEVPTVVLQWTVFGVSAAIALAFGLPQLPPLDLGGDPTQVVAALLQWVADFIAAIAPAFTFATLVYSTLLKKVLDGINQKLFGVG